MRSLSTEICNAGTVNCDNSEKVGKKIQEQLDNVYFHDATTKRWLKVRNIECLYNSVKIRDKKFVAIKPAALFLRLGTQPCYETPGDLRVELVENAVINIGLVRLSLREWPKVGCGTAK